jgi:hypothetical protein
MPLNNEKSKMFYLNVVFRIRLILSIAGYVMVFNHLIFHTWNLKIKCFIILKLSFMKDFIFLHASQVEWFLDKSFITFLQLMMNLLLLKMNHYQKLF